MSVSFSSTESEEADPSAMISKGLSSNESLMASLPTITLIRPLEPDDFAPDSCYITKPKQHQLPREEILFLPPEKPTVIGNTLRNMDGRKSKLFLSESNSRRNSCYPEVKPKSKR